MGTKRKLRFSVIIIVSFLIFMGVFVLYNSIVYKPDFDVLKFKKIESNYVNFIDEKLYTLIYPKNIEMKSSTAIIFYQGGLVDEDSYLPLLTEISKRGYGVYLLKTPFDLAILNYGVADRVIRDNSFENYILMGHSLGGTSMMKYFSEQTDLSSKIGGLILLSSYSDGSYIFDSTRNSDYLNDVPILSILPSKDGVINLDAYNSDKQNLSKNTEYFILEGGNHSGFGNYGEQRGDNIRSISIEKQQNMCIDKIHEFIK